MFINHFFIIIIISGDLSFYLCASITQIILTSGLTQIGPGTQIFQQTSVTSLTVPSTVTAMGERDIIIIIIIIIIIVIIIIFTLFVVQSYFIFINVQSYNYY